MRTDLQLSSRMDLNDLAKALSDSGFFSDSRKAPQAVVKVLAGQELGIGPVQSMMGLFIVEGRVTVSASLASALLVRTGKYKYRVREHTDKVCAIEFFEGDESVGTSEFTIEDAKRAGLVKDRSAWVKWPKNMLFARALTNGIRWYAPDALAGRVEAVADEELREVRAEVVEAQGSTGDRLRDIAKKSGTGATVEPDPPTLSVDEMRRYVQRRLSDDEEAAAEFYGRHGEDYPDNVLNWTNEQVETAHGELLWESAPEDAEEQ